MTGSRNVPFPADELLRAVRLEIAAELRSEGDGEKVSLTSGQKIADTGETREYLFHCKRWKDAFSGAKLLVRLSRSRGVWSRAEATRMPDGTIKVCTDADLGGRPGNAQVRLDDSAGWESLADRLASVGAGDDAVNLTTAGWMVGMGRPRLDRCATPERFIRGYRERALNAAQRRAIEQALGSEITFIWGPPGTGKTDVVASIAEGCCRQGLRVLFVAPTKVAVDQALERVCDLLSGEESFGAGLVQRAGDIELASLAAKFGEHIDPRRIAPRLAAALTAQIADVRERLEAAVRDLALYGEAEEAERHLRDLRARLGQAADEVTSLGNEIRERQAALAGIDQETREIGTPSGLFARRKQARLDQLGQARWEHGDALIVLDRRLHDALTTQRLHADEVSSAQSRVESLRERLRRVPARAPLQQAADALRERLTALEQELGKTADLVRANCRVMGATVARAVQSRRLLDAIDVVILDEAGMVNTPSAWWAAGLAGRRVVVAGDFRQLPAVTKASGDRQASPADRAHAELWMDRDPFSTAGLLDAAGTVRRTDPRLVCLDTQYRMRPVICELVNAVAYPDAPLRTGRNDLGRLPASPLIDAPLVLVDTAPRRLPHGGGRTGGHKTNPVHEAVIHELVRGLQYDEVLPARKWTGVPAGTRPSDRMAVIAPYRDQVKALRDSLTYRFGQEYEGLVDTVHRFQGSQRPLVVIDTVAGAGDRVGYFYEHTGLASSTCRLLNVALSRAQDHLVVVADTRFLHERLPPGSEAARMLAHLERHARALSVDDLVPFRCAADLAGLPDEELARPAFFPADEVPRAIEWDVARAQTGIDVYCAFLDPAPVRRWLRHLGPRARAGVRITVHTRDQSDDPRRDALVRELEAAGCRVAVRERMHEKVLIIDDTVLWHGSLNLLANVGPTDLMMRITDPASCRRVRHIVDRARMERPARGRPDWARPRTSPDDGAGPAGAAGGKLYIKVPREEKDEFKQAVRNAGGTPGWDRERKLWHVDADLPREAIERWLPGT
ncbi:AAA domain-containing protein [Microbispora sp. CA-135349]|uniref:AAA domain-containing protein n=1 Tax=Microbispora sp. CA-135349 TaxID=3239953 RepID=UPI003D8E629D